MTTKKVKAPIGYHFMVKSSTDFYLMRTAGSYKPHQHGEYVSKLSLELEVKSSHIGSSVTPATANTTTPTRTVRTTSSTPTRTRSVYGRGTRTTGGGGGYSGGGGGSSSGGGY
jgi:uncharacterized membrane protein YgcG